MRKITVEGIEINFNDLTLEKQKELYEKNNDKYKVDASKSIYSTIRRMVVENETESSELLNRMLRDEVNGKNDGEIIDGILANEIFEIEEESIKTLSMSVDWKNRLRAAEISKDSKILNVMLINEIRGKKDIDVCSAIFKNDIFEIEEETIKFLAKSDDYRHRQKAAEISKDSKFLNEMLRREVEDGQDSDVEDAIFDNEVFEIEEETIEVLAASDNWTDRQKAAEISKDSKFLNEMLRREVKDGQDSDVEDAIFDNEVFEIEEETIKVLKTSDYEGYRQKAAELLKDSNALLEMFVNELKLEYVSSEVLKEIIENESFVFEKAALLEYIRNNY